MSFCFLYNVVSENHSVQNSPWGGLLPAQGLRIIEVFVTYLFFLAWSLDNDIHGR